MFMSTCHTISDTDFHFDFNGIKLSLSFILKEATSKVISIYTIMDKYKSDLK